MRFVHSSDWQLGMTRHFLAGEAQARYTAARIDAVGTIGALAVEEGCSFVVVSGDVFESNHVERQVVVRALDAMKAVPGVTFYLLAGNHDPLDAASVFRSVTFAENCPSNVVVIADSTPVEVAPGVEIVGAPWPNKRPLADLVSKALGGLTADGTLRIVVGHGGVTSMAPNPTDPALISVDAVGSALTSGTVHYVALGDRHSTTQVDSAGRVWYSGTPEQTDYDEVDPGNVLLVELGRGSVSVERRKVGTWTFVRKHFDVGDREGIRQVERFLDGLTDKQRTIVKLSLVGQLSLVDMAALTSELEHASELFGALEQWKRHSELVVLPDDHDFEELGLSGYGRDALEELRSIGSGTGEEASVARGALGLLFRLASVER
ncbi:MAG: exonuclease SbcCD subunit D [Actinomycetota bacterium]|nr:exonuclease SbcCD subunit D [Actinomycetota bacterium]